ncbi:ribonuclease P protein component [Xylocopilactobacillus apicola]|uniref:Ribonuclease P protein component n=1 Tax=Xylocopilactobacillus apicola TaxID=2932184 RepID=A0AAU9DB75_9LACO|nr:ribonuclease P protein component [Xylocopilactobacillus apicola]BDR59735.1 hypothetical protein XA3_21760 [Xylocopilactobacillus apicola]
MALKKSYRIKKENEFQQVYASKNSVANRYFVVYRIDKEGQKHFRVGVSVGKRISKLSVDRNRIKRYITQVIYAHRETIEPATDLIVIARKNALELDLAGVEKNLLHCLHLAQVISQQEEND